MMQRLSKMRIQQVSNRNKSKNDCLDIYELMTSKNKLDCCNQTEEETQALFNRRSFYNMNQSGRLFNPQMKLARPKNFSKAQKLIIRRNIMPKGLKLMEPRLVSGGELPPIKARMSVERYSIPFEASVSPTYFNTGQAATRETPNLIGTPFKPTEPVTEFSPQANGFY